MVAASGAGNSIVFGQVSSISALSSDSKAVPTAVTPDAPNSHSVEELERLRDTLRDILML
jgi:hypothetical protein